MKHLKGTFLSANDQHFAGTTGTNGTWHVALIGYISNIN